ncbi:lytic transglycosylase domain-containing protein [Aurantiacibacter aquimixticola]|uniref:Lytic transglycosylase domain-containing protein n=1 Tax=Aurantiacibacter aquimixticola TaxID=1958945 RepID=A0A419RVS1_9SPHN|nr:lytic transglycosylase domain-containing protein [Aurantiacibacter aquimixticola]RJY09864.1 lytic transglycosylase domain-containing protein [Aurantiacibacter aquimixticola]
MILRFRTSLAALMLTAFAALPAQAQVLEIGNDGQAAWITGDALPPAQGPVAAAPLAEVPAEQTQFLPDSAIADPAIHAAVVPSVYAAHVADLARRYDLSPALIEALVWQESRWRADAVSHAGARGLAQLMPGTARDLGVDPDDPIANLEGGARYLREQLDRFDGDLEKALAAYNAGPGRVIRSGGVPNIRETRHYVAAIMGRLSNHSRSPN